MWRMWRWLLGGWGRGCSQVGAGGRAVRAGTRQVTVTDGRRAVAPGNGVVFDGVHIGRQQDGR